MRKRTWIIAVGLLAALIVAYRVKSRREEAAANRAKASRVEAIPVTTQTIALGTLDAVAHLTGNIEPIQSVQVISKVRGRVATVAKDIGDSVKAGETLAVIEPVDYALDVKRLEGLLLQAKAEDAQATRDAARAERLFKDRIISTQALQAARARAEAGRGRVKEAEAALDLARERLADTRVTSPIDGRVTARMVDVGTMVDNQMMGNRQAVATFEVKNLSRVKIKVGISEKDLPRARVGQKARVSVDALPGHTFEGILSRVSPSLVEGTRRAEAEIEIDNPDQALKPGMFATADLVIEHREGVVLVPKASVLDRGGRQVVFLAVDGKARMVAVTLDGSDDRSYVVTAGVSPGDRLVVKGQTILEDGSPILVENAAPPSEARAASTSSSPAP
jgi:membrane fusion protein (multidrug efflux system)